MKRTSFGGVKCKKEVHDEVCHYRSSIVCFPLETSSGSWILDLFFGMKNMDLNFSDVVLREQESVDHVQYRV